MTDNIQPHIRCGVKDSANYALLPGDPQRVDRVRPFLSDVRDITFNREYKSIVGYYKGVKVMVISTGMGGPSVGIGVEELKNIGVNTMIRIGSCGALKSGMKLGDIVIANGVVRDEGTTKAYVKEIYPAVPDTSLLFDIISSAEEMNIPYHTGIVRSHDSFYTDEEDKIDNYWSNKNVIAADMESAALFVIASLRGIKAATILNVVVEYENDLEDGINSYVDGGNTTMTGEEREILTALEAIVKMDKRNK